MDLARDEYALENGRRLELARRRGGLMASVSIVREERSGTVRYRVLYRLGGREAKRRHGGSFVTKKLAEKRRDWIAGEIANLRVPDLRLLEAEQVVVTLGATAEEVARQSRRRYGRHRPDAPGQPCDESSPLSGIGPSARSSLARYAALVAHLHESGLRRESIRKTIATLAMVFDYAERAPNPARSKTVKLPQEDRVEVNPPTAEHVLAVHRLLATRYRLPLLVLDATGMRVSELEALTWGDVDETEGRWRVSSASSKTNQARWVPVPRFSSPRSSSSSRARTVTRPRRCSRASAPIASERRSRRRVRRWASRPTRHTIYAIAGRLCGT